MGCYHKQNIFCLSNFFFYFYYFLPSLHMIKFHYFQSVVLRSKSILFWMLLYSIMIGFLFIASKMNSFSSIVQRYVVNDVAFHCINPNLLYQLYQMAYLIHSSHLVMQNDNVLHLQMLVHDESML